MDPLKPFHEHETDSPQGGSVRCEFMPGCYNVAVYILTPTPDAPPDLPPLAVCRRCREFAVGNPPRH